MIATCIFLDIDECSLSWCLEKCTNFPGSHRCAVCNKGFQRDDEKEMCKGMMWLVVITLPSVPKKIVLRFDL